MYRTCNEQSALNHAAQNWLRGKPSWGKRGVAVSQMGSLGVHYLLRATDFDDECLRHRAERRAIIFPRYGPIAPVDESHTAGSTNRPVPKSDQRNTPESAI